MQNFLINKITNQFPVFLNKSFERVLPLIYKWSRLYRWTILLAVFFALHLMEFVFPSEGFKLKLPLLLVIITEIVYAIYLISLEFAFKKTSINPKLICWYRIFVDTLCYSIFFWAIGGANSDAYLLYIVPVTTAITHLGIKIGFSVFLFITSLSLFITFAPIDIQLIAAKTGISVFKVISWKLLTYSMGKIFFLFIVALVSVRAYIRELFYVKQLQSLNHSAKIVHSSIDLEDVLNVIMKQGLDLMGSKNKSFFVQILEGNNLIISAGGGTYFDPTLIGKITSLDTGITGKVAMTGEPCISPNVAADPDYHESLKETKSEIAVPVINERNSANGRVIAVLNVESKELNAFSKFHQRTLQIFADHAACSITAAQLYRQSEIEKLKLQNILEISHEVQTASIERIDDILIAILDGIKHLGYDRARIYLISEDGTKLIPTVEEGFKMTEEEFQKMGFQISEDPYTLETSKGKPKLYKNKPYGEGLHYHSLEKEDLTEWADLPLLINGQFVGKITFDNKFTNKKIHEEDLDHMMIYANYAAQAIQNSKKFQKQIINIKLQKEELRELKFLTLVAAHLQQLKELDGVVNTFLLAITVKDGLSFSRAVFLKIEDDYLIGWKAVGPLTQEEANDLWPKVSHLNFNDVINSDAWSPNESDYKINEVIKSIRIKLRDDTTDSLANINNKRLLVLSSDTISEVDRNLLSKLNSDRMIFVPFVSKNRLIGAIIADMQFTGKSLSPVRINMLEIFSKYIAIAIENTQLVQDKEQQQLKNRILEAFENLSKLYIHSFGSLAGRLYDNLDEIQQIDLPDSRIENQLNEIEKVAEHLENIKERLLLHLQRLDFESEADSEETLRKVISLFENEFKKYSITFDLDIRNNPKILFDQNILEQIYLIVIDNAIKAVIQTKNDRRIHIKQELSSNQETLKLKMSDTGFGFTSEARSKALRTENYSEWKDNQGTGIGLYTCHVLLELFGGEIDIADLPEPGLKTTVVIKLPIDNSHKGDDN